MKGAFLNAQLLQLFAMRISNPNNIFFGITYPKARCRDIKPFLCTLRLPRVPYVREWLSISTQFYKY